MACGPGTVAFSFDATNPRALAWARERSAALVTSIRDDARLAIRELVGRAFEDGIPPKSLARMIRDVVGLTPRDALAVERRYIEAVRRGVSPDVASRSASAYADRLHRRRALTIARTETMASSVRGQEELWQQAVDAGALRPRGLQKEWLATGDETVCDICGPMDGQRVAFNQAFSVEGPPAHPQCRCCTGLVRAD